MTVVPMPQITATIQARMGSSRLPGKVLMPILDRPMLAYQIERLQQSLLIDRIIIATSDNEQDNVLEAFGVEMGIEVFRGSEDDVLGRVAACLRTHNVDIHVEFQGDNPLPDAHLVDAFIGYFLKHDEVIDYLTNAITTTYPPGAEIAVYRARTLARAEAVAPNDSLREHVGIHVHRRPDLFRVISLEAPEWLHAPDIHLEVDSVEDFRLIRTIIEHFFPRNPGFSLGQAIEFVRANKLTELNKDVERRWTAFRSDP
jgi:spore coat polysaccharide biosynthesis protein SpsF